MLVSRTALILSSLLVAEQANAYPLADARARSQIDGSHLMQDVGSQQGASFATARSGVSANRGFTDAESFASGGNQLSFKAKANVENLARRDLTNSGRNSSIEAQSSASFVEIVSANTNFRATLNFFLGRLLSINISDDRFYREALDQEQAQSGETVRLSSVSASGFSFMQLFEYDAINEIGTNFLGEVAVYDGLSLNLSASFDESGEIQYFQNFLGQTLVETRSFGPTGNLERTEEVTNYQLSDFGKASERVFQAYDFSVQFKQGTSYILVFNLECGSRISGVAALTRGSRAVCDASRSLYWTGLTDIQPADGVPGPATLISSSGFDLRNPSPDFRAAIPEPSTWGLLLVGFFSIGLMERRKGLRNLRTHK
jgi:hypothetical protein